MAVQALSDIKVLDLTWYISGPYCTRLLADYGADVIKVEKPTEGDPARKLGPFLKDEPHPEKSGLFLNLNINKRGVTLNLKSEWGRKVIKELVKDTDILVENFSPGVMEKLGLDYDTLKTINPGLVMTSISNYGQTGPYRDFKATELVLFAMGSAMYSHGIPEFEPLKYALTVLQFQAGGSVAAATLGAYYGSRYKGVGQYLDVSIMETAMGNVDTRMTECMAYQYSGRINTRQPWGGGFAVGIYACTDGYIDIAAGASNLPRLVEMVNDDRLRDPKYADPAAAFQPELKEEFDEVWLGWLGTHSKKEVVEACLKHNVWISPVQTAADVVEDPHFNERGLFVEVQHPVMGKVKIAGCPFIMEKTPWQLRRPAPLIGQHNEEVYTGLGYSKEELVVLRQQGII